MLRDTLEATVAPESSSESGEVETVRYAWSATASSVASVRLTSQRVAGRDLEDQPVLPGCPSLVLQSLLQAARRQMDWGRRKFRLGDIRRVNVASLEERLESSPPNLPHHGSERRPHAWHTIEGQRMSVFLGILLEDVRMTNIISRVQPGKNGSIPAQCTNPVQLHQTYSVSFKKICAREFDALNPTEKRSKLTEFHWRRFS